MSALVIKNIWYVIHVVCLRDSPDSDHLAIDAGGPTISFYKIVSDKESSSINPNIKQLFAAFLGAL